MTQWTRNDTGLSSKEIESAIDKVWDGSDCCKLDLYWVGQEKLTQAEALLKFMTETPVHVGEIPREQAVQRFQRCSLVKPAESRDVPAEWRQDAIERELQYNLNQTRPRTPSL